MRTPDSPAGEAQPGAASPGPAGDTLDSHSPLDFFFFSPFFVFAVEEADQKSNKNARNKAVSIEVIQGTVMRVSLVPRLTILVLDELESWAENNIKIKAVSQQSRESDQRRVRLVETIFCNHRLHTDAYSKNSGFHDEG